MKHIKRTRIIRKTKSGGSARFPLSQEVLDATIKEAMPPTMQKSGECEII
jgi:hypothetical protein